MRAVIALGAGALAAAAFAGGVAFDAFGDSDSLDQLRARLDAESAARDRLERQVEKLEAGVASLRAGTQVVDEAAVYRGGSAAEAGEAADDARAVPAAGDETASDATPGHAWFDEKRLAQAGLPDRDVADLHHLFEDVELQRLYLQNQAQREGWPQGKLLEAMNQLDDRLLSVRQQYGEDTYDWFLYASGRSNRVVVEGVLGGSAAADAGLREGDVIVSYGGERIFKPGALVQGTLTGTLDDRVDVSYLRDGETHVVTLPRGPLGVRLGRSSAEPSPLP